MNNPVTADTAREMRARDWERLALNVPIPTADSTIVKTAYHAEAIARYCFVELADAPLAKKYLMLAADILNTPVTTVGAWWAKEGKEGTPVDPTRRLHPLPVRE